MFKRIYAISIIVLLMVLGALILSKHKTSAEEPPDAKVKGDWASLVFDIPDLNVTDWYYYYGYSAIQNNLTFLYPDNNFYPKTTMTRAGAAIQVARVAQLTGCCGVYNNEIPCSSCGGRATFKDVPPDYWAYDAIEAVGQAHVMLGYADGTFRPGELEKLSTFPTIVSRARGGATTQNPPGYSSSGTYVSNAQAAALLTWNFNENIYMHFSGKLVGLDENDPVELLSGSKVKIVDSKYGTVFGEGEAMLDSTSGEVKFDFTLDWPIQHFFNNVKGRAFEYYVSTPENSGFESDALVGGALNLINNDNAIVFVKNNGRKVSGEIVFPPGCEAEAQNCFDALNEANIAMGLGPLDSIDILALAAMGLDNEEIQAAELGSSGLTPVGSGKITWHPDTRKLTYEVAIDQPPTDAKNYSLFYSSSDDFMWVLGEARFNAGQQELTGITLTARSTLSVLKVVVVDKATGQPIPDVSITLPGTDSDLASQGLYKGLTDLSGSAMLAELSTPLENYPKNIVINVYPPAYTGFAAKTNFPVSLTGCFFQSVIVELY